MAIVVTEGINSREQDWGTSPSATLEYYVSGTNDEAAADAAVRAQLNLYRGLWPNSLRVEPYIGTGSDGLYVFRVVVQYGPTPGGLSVDGEDDQEPSYTAEFSTELVKIQQALAVVNNYPAPGEPGVNFRGAINVTSEGVEGVEIEVPVQQFSLTISVPTVSLTKAYKATIARLTGSINNSPWYGYQAKEVLFRGLSASGVFGDRSSLTYRFAVSPNASGLTIGDITGITKAGWDYLWCFYRDATDDDAKMMIKKPLQVNVVQVYPLANFLELGLGS